MVRLKLKRQHLIEIHDQAWCPNSVRNCVRGLIRQVCVNAPVYRSITPRLFEAVKKTQSKKVVDLCSGVGGPWEQLLKSKSAAGEKLEKVTLTDLFPHPEICEGTHKSVKGKMEYYPEPVNATKVPEEHEGFRTLFASFHHFEPDMAKGILQDAVDNEVGIGIFEMTDRSLAVAIGIFSSSLIAPYILVPFMKPFDWQAVFWTYIVPVTPWVAAIDGAVSCLRTYSPEELKDLVSGLGEEDYEWQIGKSREKFSPFAITYLIGYPMSADQ